MTEDEAAPGAPAGEASGPVGALDDLVAYFARLRRALAEAYLAAPLDPWRAE